MLCSLHHLAICESIGMSRPVSHAVPAYPPVFPSCALELRVFYLTSQTPLFFKLLCHLQSTPPTTFAPAPFLPDQLSIVVCQSQIGTEWVVLEDGETILVFLTLTASGLLLSCICLLCSQLLFPNWAPPIKFIPHPSSHSSDPSPHPQDF